MTTKASPSLADRVEGRLKKMGFVHKFEGFRHPSGNFRVAFEYVPSSRDLQIVLLTFLSLYNPILPDHNKIESRQQGSAVRVEPIINSSRPRYQISYRTDEVSAQEATSAVLGFISYIGKYFKKK